MAHGPEGCGKHGGALLDELIGQWDGRSLPPDVKLQRRIELDIAGGLSLPDWDWPVPRAYNGASGEERVRGWQITRIAIDRQWLARAACCSICRSRQYVHRHSELYGRPLLAMPICRDCHFRLHRRFREPEAWTALCDQYQASAWIGRLSLVELTGSQARELERQPNPLGLLDR